MSFPRASGLLLHPTSLPGRFGIGDFGDEAYRFADFLIASGQSLWQVLPLGPTGYGEFTLRVLFGIRRQLTLLISPEQLFEEGLRRRKIWKKFLRRRLTGSILNSHTRSRV